MQIFYKVKYRTRQIRITETNQEVNYFNSTGSLRFFFNIVLFQSSLEGRKEGNVLFNDALNTFYLRLYGVGHMVKYHSDSERGNPLPPHGLFFPISSKGSFICTIP